MSAAHRVPSVASRLRAAVGIDWSLLTPVRGLVTALPVGACVGVPLLFHQPSTAVVMGVAANLIAIISLVGAPVIPLRYAVADGVQTPDVVQQVLTAVPPPVPTQLR